MSFLFRSSRVMGTAALLVISTLALDAQPVVAQAAPPSQAKAASASTPAWVQRSNENARVLLDVVAKFSPEQGSSMGIEGVDNEIVDIRPGYRDRARKAMQQSLAELKKREAAETDPLVKQDLSILVNAAQDSIRSSELDEKYFLPYLNLPQLVFGASRVLLDEQTAASRRPAALVRLRKYAGLEPGYTPLARLAMQDATERMKNASLTAPYRGEIEKDLAQADFFIQGIGELFQKYQVAGYEQPYNELKKQFAEYNEFVRTQLLPRARKDYRLPPEVYAQNLHELGIDIPPAELASMAHGAFTEIQNHMQTLATEIARQRNLPSSDYRDVIRELKKKQIVGDAILPHYQSRLKEIETIIRRENLLTLPSREARIRIASPAEAAGTPAPNMRPPRLLGNTGEMGEFILPLNIPAAAGSGSGKTQSFDDFTFEAASWTLTAHEARPGHELQFASMVEKGVSNARAIFAFNSTNAEGWGLYSEYILFPFMPAEGKLISLQHRMMRSARAFLDPELQAGKVTPEQAKHVLMNDVMLSEAMANQEVERYTFRSPGQATSYFYGYVQLVNLRRDAQNQMGANFSPQRFHDFVLAQGLLPPRLMRKAVMENFVAKPGTRVATAPEHGE